MVVEYAVTTGGNVTPEQASAGLFPGCRVVWIGEDRNGRTVTYFYLVEQDGDVLTI
jgi:hypothetical protein